LFSDAYVKVKDFVRPVVISTLLENGKVNCGFATFIVVNADGWVVTAAHVLNALLLSKQHLKEKADYEAKVAEIRADPMLSVKLRNRKLEGLKPNPEWILNQSLWWNQNAANAKEYSIDIQADIAIVKLENFNTADIVTFPKFKPANADPPLGGHLCRMGYAFADMQATFNHSTNTFEMQSPVPPIFPNDGLHTRIRGEPDVSGNRVVKFIETSTPGLMGQSGGPLFDRLGEIWGIQVKTNFMELGFSPKKKDGAGKEFIEHQFLNVGLASHVTHLIDLFNRSQVKFETA
jgi:hypothetical protein